MQIFAIVVVVAAAAFPLPTRSHLTTLGQSVGGVVGPTSIRIEFHSMSSLSFCCVEIRSSHNGRVCPVQRFQFGDFFINNNFISFVFSKARIDFFLWPRVYIFVKILEGI